MATKTSKAEAQKRRNERGSALARRVGTTFGGWVDSRIEHHLLTRSWRKIKPSTLRGYLVQGYQHPAINVQSILARHELIRDLYGDVFGDLMKEEIQWAADHNEAYAAGRRELINQPGADFQQLKKSGKIRGVYDKVMADSDLYATRWTEALRQPPSKRLTVIEAACGSANDYRFFRSYGLAQWLDYSGFDLTVANIENARTMFPGVDFQLGDVQEIAAADNSYDWAVTHDLLEHVSPTALERAMDELCRVARKGVIISFFRMTDRPDHEISPRKMYHVNELSKDLIHARFSKDFPNITWVELRPMVKEATGYASYYNKKAWSMIARA